MSGEQTDSTQELHLSTGSDRHVYMLVDVPNLFRAKKGQRFVGYPKSDAPARARIHISVPIEEAVLKRYTEGDKEVYYYAVDGSAPYADK